MNLELLKQPFLEEEIEWRIGRSGITNGGKPWAMCLAYVTSRAIMDRLDAVCGPENWKDEYEPMEIPTPDGGVVAGIKCKLSIRVYTNNILEALNEANQHLDNGCYPFALNKLEGEWMSKEDGAQCTNIEAFKGGLSDALKRAAVKWGIGRYLYNLEEGWANVTEDKREKSQKVMIKDNSGQKHYFWWTPPQLPTWAISQDDLFQK